MENFTPEIKKMLIEKLKLYKDLNRILTDEREFIFNIDVDALWKTAEEKKRTAGEIQEVRGKLLGIFKNRLGFEGMGYKTFSLSYLIRILPIKNEQKSDLRKLKTAIENEKNELDRLTGENKNFVQEYLGVIDDIMSVAVDNSTNARYDFSGTLPGDKKSRSLIHAKV